MKLLILGGTRFLGRALVEYAQQRGHEITLFNRGQSNPDLFQDIEQIHGDRSQDLSGLAGREWDAVIDTCGFFPGVVRKAAEALANSVKQYVFISSISVYKDFSVVGLTEDAAVGTIDPEAVEQVTSLAQITEENYGPLKALCEEEAERAFPGQALIVRPGLIVGPHDGSDRFTYWVKRIAQGGETLATGTPDDPIQSIDVRDLAGWTIRMVEQGQSGVYHATGPDYRLNMGQLLSTCQTVAGSDVELVWVGTDFAVKHDLFLQPWVPATGEYAGFNSVDCNKAINAGLTFRPLAETVRDTLTWKGDAPLKPILPPEREAELLKEWHESQKTEA